MRMNTLYFLKLREKGFLLFPIGNIYAYGVCWDVEENREKFNVQRICAGKKTEKVHVLKMFTNVFSLSYPCYTEKGHQVQQLDSL